MPTTKTPAKPAGGSATVWTAEERAAMREGAREKKRSARLSPDEERAAGERDVRAKIAEMPEPDRGMAARIHELVLGADPTLAPKTYYGMPGWARDGRLVCFFKPKSKFREKYAHFEFQVDAGLDDGDMWPVSFAVKGLTPATEATIVALVRRAARG